MKIPDEVPEKLLADAISLENRSTTLKNTALWLNDEIEKIANELAADEKINSMSWDEAEAAYKKLEELMGRLFVEVKELVKLNEEYRSISMRINKIYGKTVMEILPPLKFEDIVGPLIDGEDDL